MKILINLNEKMTIPDLKYKKEHLDDYINDLIEATKNNQNDILGCFQKIIGRNDDNIYVSKELIELFNKIAENPKINIWICREALWFLKFKTSPKGITKKDILINALKSRKNSDEKINLCFWCVRGACDGKIEEQRILKDIYNLFDEFEKQGLLSAIKEEIEHNRTHNHVLIEYDDLKNLLI